MRQATLRNDLKLELNKVVKERDIKGENHKDYDVLCYYIKTIEREISELEN